MNRKPIFLCALAAGLASATSAQVVDSSVVRDVLEQTNALRQREGRVPVETNPALTRAAQAFAEFMAQTDRYGHDADGREPTGRAAQHGYQYCIVSENIEFRARSPEFTSHELATLLVDGWERSPVHRGNMLDPDVRDTGVGVARSTRSGRWYGVQMFGRSKTAQTTYQVTNEGRSVVHYRVAERAFELAPQVTRTHEQCRPAPVTVTPGDAQPKTIQPKAGERYALQQDAAGRWNYTRGPLIPTR